MQSCTNTIEVYQLVSKTVNPTTFLRWRHVTPINFVMFSFILYCKSNNFSFLISLIFSCVSNSMNWKFTDSQTHRLTHIWTHSKISITMTMYGHVWSCMFPYGPVWSRMVLYGPIWSHMALYGPVWSNMVPYCSL